MSLLKGYKAKFEIASKVMTAMAQEIVGLREKIERLEKSGRMLTAENEELHAMCKSYEAELQNVYKNVTAARASLDRIRK